MIHLMIDEGKFGIFVFPQARRNTSKLIQEAKAVGPYTEKLVTFALRHYQGMQIMRTNFHNNVVCEPEEMAMRLCAGFGIR